MPNKRLKTFLEKLPKRQLERKCSLASFRGNMCAPASIIHWCPTLTVIHSSTVRKDMVLSSSNAADYGAMNFFHDDVGYRR